MQPHWNSVYLTKAPDELSWFRAHLEISLGLIERATQGRLEASVIDVGGGASTLVDDLLRRGYRNITVLDIAKPALDAARDRMGEAAGRVDWRCADITRTALPSGAFDVWHDRALFHFLTAPEDRAAYVRNLASGLRPGGHVIVAAFGVEGPRKCSGLDVVRYDAPSLLAELGPHFELVESRHETHATPFGTAQQFLYCCCRLRGARP